MAMRSLQSDTRGAIMVMAVFMAMIAIGSLYYMVGLGDAILAQERMQDAADASAFSAAIIHARGMNLLALINIIMAALLAILVLLSMLASLFTVGVVILAAIAWFFPPAASLIPPTNTAAQAFSKAESKARPGIHKAIRALHKLQGPLNKAIPALASVNAVKLSSVNYGDVVTVGVTFPIFSGLPTREGKFPTLCEKAGELAGQIAVIPITKAIGDNFLSRKLAGAAEDLGSTYAQFYCGNGPKPKAPTFKEDISIPEINSGDRVSCEKKREADACKRYEDQVKALQTAYDETKGECKANPDNPEVERLCNVMRGQARSQCNPEKSKEFIKHYTWVERRYTRHWVLVGKGANQRVVKTGISNESYKPKKGKGYLTNFTGSASPVPCGHPGVMNNANRDMTRWDESKAPDEALCETKFREPTVAFMKATHQVSYSQQILEVVDVLRCTVEREIKAELKGERMKPKLKKEMKPQEMCSCAALGEKSFQVRSIVLGDPKEYTADADKKILVATQGKEAAQSRAGELMAYGGRGAAAQAEFYYDDGDTSPQEWLWNLKWKARMRRLTFGRKAYQCPVHDTCSTERKPNSSNLSPNQAREVEALKQLMSQADNIIVH